MSRRAVVSWLALAMVAVLAAGASAAAMRGGAGHGRHRRPVAPARMLVYAQEWSLVPSRRSLPAGQVTVQLWNRGEDAHDLRIRRLNRSGTMVGRTRAVALTQSGALHQATWKLGAGTYEMYCSLPGHLMRGMHVRIVVHARR